ncbi:MAG: hypothetical protein RBR47_03540 [Bacteroidales bacterium]|jgi:anti-sigma factor RsiW|nr:hypothetical protein [Bacteroidales bacterium]NCU36373.1 hypothetical protein [Candidatus Falkowbacteria bacterium]MDD3130975.1 hypothetical protein [Bacteroidales bacterium]MDD3526802.1 hypothetical protein [Bacteroidales bacterium]MDD4741168.1 hypothetical protein [Bacteroidales bacterium]
MHNETLFLKYLDKELTAKEAAQVEKLVSEDPAQKEIFDRVKTRRAKAIEALRLLNPEKAEAAPPFDHLEIKPEKRIRFIPKYWRYAAAIIVLAAAGLWLYFDKNENPVVTVQAEMPAVDNLPDQFEELNYYISPNRCWHNRQMVGGTNGL